MHLSNLGNLTRNLTLPDGFTMPTTLAYEDIRGHVLGRRDLADDVRGINASLDLIRRTRGGEWPTEPVTDEFDYIDLVWHECEFREGYSFSYAVYHEDGRYMGCLYLYPMGRRTRLTEARLDHDVDVSWWVTSEFYERGYYRKLYDAARHWLATDWPFATPYFSNAEIP
jgi:hypothetical protein